MTEYLYCFLLMLLQSAEILVAVFGLAWSFDGRGFFPLRVILSALGGIACAALSAIVCFLSPDDGIRNVVFYVLMSLFAFLSALFSFRGAASNIAFVCGIALSARFLALESAETACLILSENGAFLEEWAEYLIRFAAIVVVYVLVRLLFRRMCGENMERYVGGIAAFLFPMIVATTAVLDGAAQILLDFAFLYRIILSACGVFYGLVLLFTEYAFLIQGQSELELSIVKSLWNEDKKHYEMQKESMDIINIKCHDLRHQIQNLRARGPISEQAIEEIENSIYIYDSVIRTDNEVLDVVLSDYSLRCQKNNVLLTCMADGEKIGFMEEMDVYSLFGNMLENALEYEQTVQPTENRFISLTVKAVKDFVLIHAENYYEGNATVRDGVVATTKKGEDGYHGFGMKSMKKIVEKYNGSFEVIIADGMFQVEILLPAAQTGKGPQTKAGKKPSPKR